MPTHDRPPRLTYFERPPYHIRVGSPTTAPRPKQIVEYTPVPEVPEALMIAADWMIDATDRDRMSTYDPFDDDPIKINYGLPQAQLPILAEEKAAARLQRDAPDVYESLVAIVRSQRTIQGVLGCESDQV